MPQAHATVVLVHGLWLPSWTMAFLAYRLRRAGFATAIFPYPTVKRSLAENAAALAAFVRPYTAHGPVHYVGYSLGGVVLRALCAAHPFSCHTRVVTLGSPHQGSAAARSLARFALGRRMLGRSIGDVCAHLPAGWPPAVGAWGTIAGSLEVGLGRAIARLDTPNDGTVAASEARLPWAVDHVVVPVTHLGMLVSPTVAAQVIRFLQQGRFA